MSDEEQEDREKPRWLLILGLIVTGLVIGFVLWLPSSAPTKAPGAWIPSEKKGEHKVVDVRWIHGELSDAEAHDYVGDAACEPCHKSIVTRARTTRHARTLRPITLPEDGPYFRSAQILSDSNMGYRYNTAVEDGICVMRTVSTNGKVISPVTWVLGSGKNARSFLSHSDSEGWSLIRLTYYTGTHQWEFTPHQQPGDPVQTAAGVPQTHEGLTNCLSCHVTVLRAGFDEPDISKSQLGVGCERCHGAGKTHVETYRQHGKNPVTDPLLENLKLQTPQYINKLCGACHRDETNAPVGDPQVENDLARYEGAALARSKCYLKSGKLSCITCHDPHADVDTNPAHNDTLCLNCHAGPKQGAAPTSAQGNTCPVNAKTGCTKCHMPRQEVLGIPYAHYTNHWIKVWGDTKAH